MQVKLSESQLLELMELKKIPDCDFHVEPKSSYLGFDIRLHSMNVKAFLEIFKNKRLGLSDSEESKSPIAQKELRPKRFISYEKSTYTKSKVYNGFVRDDV